MSSVIKKCLPVARNLSKLISQPSFQANSVPFRYSFPRITHCIFDFDGLLVDTETVFLSAIKSVVQRYGKHLNGELRSEISGLWISQSGKILINKLDLPISLDEYLHEVRTQFNTMIPQISLMPGVENLVKRLYENEIPMAICTGRSSDTFAAIVAKFGDFFKEGKYFHHILTAADDAEVKRNKPHPDPYFVCAERFSALPRFLFGPKAQNILVFEDSIVGIKAALAARMHCVFVADPRLPPPKHDTEVFSEVSMIYNSLDQFEHQLFDFGYNAPRVVPDLRFANM